MISCFLSLNNDNTAKKIFIMIFIFVPLYNLIFFLTQAIIVLKSKTFKSDSENRSLFKNHCIYTVINILCFRLIKLMLII